MLCPPGAQVSWVLLGGGLKGSLPVRNPSTPDRCIPLVLVSKPTGMAISLRDTAAQTLEKGRRHLWGGLSKRTRVFTDLLVSNGDCGYDVGQRVTDAHPTHVARRVKRLASSSGIM